MGISEAHAQTNAPPASERHSGVRRVLLQDEIYSAVRCAGGNSAPLGKPVVQVLGNGTQRRFDGLEIR